MYDLAILGGGPAGLAAAIYASRKQINICLVSGDLGGQILLTGEVANYLGFELISAADLVQKFESQIVQSNLEQFLGEQARLLRKKDDQFLIQTDAGRQIEAQAVLAATGKRSRRLGVPGEKEFAGRGVSYCSTCDAPFFQGAPVAVVGGGNSAFEAAIDNLTLSPRIYLLNLADQWQADEVYQNQVLKQAKLTAMLKSRIKEIRGDSKVRSILVETPAGEQTLEAAAVFVEIGLIPNTEFLRGTLELTPGGEIVVDCACRTSVPGIFAAGDATTVPEKQIIIAAGEGAKAALTAYRWLIAHGKI